MSEQPIKLSKLELQVMRPFWSAKEITIREAADVLSRMKDDPGYSTVQTIAGRLEKKGAILKARKEGKSWFFKAAIEKTKVVNRMIDELVSLLDGASNPILSHLVESEKMGQAELDEIREMIASKTAAKKN